MDRINRVVYVDTPNPEEDISKVFSPCGEIRGVYRWKSEREKVHFFVEFRQTESVNRARVSRLPPETHVHSLAFIPQLIDRFCSLTEDGNDPVNVTELPSPVRRRYRIELPRSTGTSGASKFSSTFGRADFNISTRDQEKKENDSRPISPSLLPVSLTGPASTLSSINAIARLVLSICDEQIVYDLDALDEDPKGIIKLLKLSSCERDKWMIVGCHYRRRGNPQAALLVILSMVEVMTRAGTPETDLRPAFLMLSGCETDIGRRARSPAGAHTEVSLKHFQQSQDWLRKVYGVDLPPVDVEAEVPPIASSPDAKITSLFPGLPAAPQALVTGHTRILEREVQSLRERNSASQDQIFQIKAVKRKLEDELLAEKSVRRKVETTLVQIETELKASQRMESFALEQVRREVESRRLAEGREKDLFTRVEELERELKKGAEVEKVVLFEDLAKMFQMAAHGDSLLLPSMGNEEAL